ncbi:hypothetical protein LGR54_24585 [Ancylobacter sp. Lp-2]|uniref:hypothetical protein n=1 Tax=Ancylobacter sp. Lp-2 TaxID=2881339 RepID=UPI001E2D6C00|nr:hypothetical protein [Ancylobacter sp. Lp-2]MCB4771793.1 hypothetical protein [Ancylobacter sp. Lp-2]
MTIHTPTPAPDNDDDCEARWQLHDKLVTTASQLHTMIRFTQIAWQQGYECDKAMMDTALDVLLGLAIDLENTAYEI